MSKAKMELAVQAVLIIVLWLIHLPPKKATKERGAVKTCRAGLTLVILSWGFGLVGYGLALAAFILGIVGITQGKVAYGIFIILLAIVVPLLSTMVTAAMILEAIQAAAEYY